MVSFKVEEEISKESLSDLLCCAFEGGANYWAISPYNNAREVGAKYGFEAPLYGGFFTIEDIEKGGKYKIGAAEIQKGLKLFSKQYIRHYADFINDDFDVEIGDVFLQCCVFGEVIYG